MSKQHWKYWLYLGTCWLLGGVFIYAGILKANDSQAFADNIAAYQLLPEPLINPIALGLPIFEILAGLLLITGWQRRLGTLAILSLTILFALFITSAIARGLHIDCGCFGSSTIPLRYQLWFALVRDAVLFAATFVLYLTDLLSPCITRIALAHVIPPFPKEKTRHSRS